MKTVCIREYDKDNNIVNEYHQCQGTLNNLDEKLIKTQKDTKKIQVQLWVNFSDNYNYTFNFKRSFAKQSKNGDTTYINLYTGNDIDKDIFYHSSQSNLPEYIKIRD